MNNRAWGVFITRESVHLEKGSKPLIQHRIDRTHSTKCDEGFTVIGESRGSQDNLSGARSYILVRRVSLGCSGPSRIIVFQEHIHRKFVVRETTPSSLSSPLLPPSLSLSVHVPLTTICFPGDLNLGNGH